MYNIYYTENSQLNEFAERLRSKFKVFSAVIKTPNFTKETDYSYKILDKVEPIVFNPYRVVEPLKSFFTYPQEKVSEYFVSDEKIINYHPRSADAWFYKFLLKSGCV